MDQVLVTGAGGFIGSHLVERLVASGYKVRAFVHYNGNNNLNNLNYLPPDVLDQVDIVLADITDPFAVSTAVKDCRFVFHLAALIGIPYSYLAPASYVATNVSGTLNVVEACRQHGCEKMLHTSTSETYGSAQYVPIDEAHPLVGQSPYSASKIGADKIAESYWLSFETPVTIVRPFNTYGPRQSTRAIIPTIISQYLTQDRLTLGSLDPVRDLTFATDTADGFIAAAQSDKVTGLTVNLGFGSGVTIGDLVTMIGELMNRQLQVETEAQRVRPENSEVRELISDNSQAKALMGWEPQVSLKAGLGQTIEFIRENIDKLNTNSYSV